MPFNAGSYTGLTMVVLANSDTVGNNSKKSVTLYLFINKIEAKKMFFVRYTQFIPLCNEYFIFSSYC